MEHLYCGDVCVYETNDENLEYLNGQKCLITKVPDFAGENYLVDFLDGTQIGAEDWELSVIYPANGVKVIIGKISVGEENPVYDKLVFLKVNKENTGFDGRRTECTTVEQFLFTDRYLLQYEENAINPERLPLPDKYDYITGWLIQNSNTLTAEEKINKIAEIAKECTMSKYYTVEQLNTDFKRKVLEVIAS